VLHLGGDVQDTSAEKEREREREITIQQGLKSQ